MESNINETKHRDFEIDLKFFFTVLRKCWYWILLAALLFGLLSGVYFSVFVEKKYSSTVKMYVDPRAQTSSSGYNSSTADALEATYPPVIRHSDSFSKAVALEMALLKNEDGTPKFPSWTYRNLGTQDEPNLVADNWGRVRGMMTTGIRDEKIFYITVTSTNPEEAYYLAEIAAKVAPEVLNDIVKVGDAKVIGYPSLDHTPDSPNVVRNAVLAAVVAAVLVYVVFFLIHLFDTTIYLEKDLARFGLPILGVVPSFPTAEDEKSRKNAKEGRNE